MELRPLGNTGIMVSPVAFGAWPIAGLTSAGTNDEDSIATIQACFDLGINHIDTAYCYGIHGESERLVARALGTRRSEMVIATKGGLHWDADGKQAHDASPAMLRRECEESLRRLETDYVDLYYLHAPDPKVPVAESAAAFRRLMEEGKTRSVGVSNVTVAQLEEFAAVCPIAAYQPPYNMLQRQIEADTLPWCRARGVAVLVYWPLMKGLLAGKLRRDQGFEGDSRRKYPMFQGEEYQKNLDLVEKLRAIAAVARASHGRRSWSSTGRSTSPASPPPSAGPSGPSSSARPPAPPDGRSLPISSPASTRRSPSAGRRPRRHRCEGMMNVESQMTKELSKDEARSGWVAGAKRSVAQESTPGASLRSAPDTRPMISKTNQWLPNPQMPSGHSPCGCTVLGRCDSVSIRSSRPSLGPVQCFVRRLHRVMGYAQPKAQRLDLRGRRFGSQRVNGSVASCPGRPWQIHPLPSPLALYSHLPEYRVGNRSWGKEDEDSSFDCLC